MNYVFLSFLISNSYVNQTHQVTFHKEEKVHLHNLYIGLQLKLNFHFKEINLELNWYFLQRKKDTRFKRGIS